VSARSALESLTIAIFAGACGFFICYLWLSARVAQTANESLAKNIAAIESAAPKIAAQITRLQASATAHGGLARDFAALKPTLDSLADCPVSPDFERLLSIQDTEINASASADTTIKSDLHKGGRN